MPLPSLPGTSRLSLNAHLYKVSKVHDDLRHLILDIARSAKYIQSAIRATEAGLAGSRNQFGEEQIKLDVLSDEIISAHLQESKLCAAFISEEQQDVVELEKDAPYSVVFDPMDGSSLVDVNFAVGSIFGIYQGSTVIGRTSRDLKAALYVVYGPRTLLVYTAGNGVHEFILNEVGEFVLLREFLGIGDSAKNYSPGNMGGIADNPGYKAVVDSWMGNPKMSLRYSGCMVSDVHHIISKGQGVFAYPGGAKYPDGKLRLVFECGPLSFIAEAAGGASSTGTVPVLDLAIKEVDQRCPIVIGSKSEVERVCSLLG